MIRRIYDDLEKHIKPGQALIIYGPRRVGKTTLLKAFLEKTKMRYKLDSGDNIRTQHTLSSQDFSQIFEYVEGYDLIAIDEAQNIPNIGMALKIIVDNKPNIKVIATGSSSFALSGQIGEPLVGRKKTLTLFPVSQKELLLNSNNYDLKQKLEEFLIFGSYPKVLTEKTKEKRIEVLQEIVNSYLLMDILALEDVKGSKVLLDLLKLLSFQIGSEVSLNELSRQLELNVKTVNRYLDLLEKVFVIKPLTGYSRNLRKEVRNKYKYYFIDNGIRNAVISQFNSLDSRNDIGALWENFLVMERLKKQAYQPIYANNYFWRTWDKNEIDFVEERDGKLFGFEFKWSGKSAKGQKMWLETYKEAEFQVVTRENYLDFMT